jgi:hypothetical protein
MNNDPVSPRILLISQWPSVKNGEYELIEKIKKTGYKITVVDFFGFDVESGRCLNASTLHLDYDFAISFHYDTPKFLNLPIFLWVANPLEFMHLRGDYRNVLLHHLRAYDEYLYNGSDVLKRHIKNVVGSEWNDSQLEMFPACSRGELVPPKQLDQLETEAAHKVFYCGVNWERGSDRAGRAQGLLDILQQKDAADFYGPNKLEGISPWEGFSSYKGEIPFDGVSMMQVMRQYGAVLAVSSPAHIKSETSSSRVFEGIAAGVPVISDENPHVKHLFGDLVYYFSGRTEQERALSILAELNEINTNPSEARSRVLRAQKLMSERFCFEPSFERALRYRQECMVVRLATLAGRNLDVFLLHHDVDPRAEGSTADFLNFLHVAEAAGHAAQLHGVHVRIIICGGVHPGQTKLPENVSLEEVKARDLTGKDWEKLRLGEKVSLLSPKNQADFVTFLTQFDYSNYDAFSKALDWFSAAPAERANGIHVGGFYVNDQSQKAPLGTSGILRNNSSLGLYRWSQNSLAEHQLATLMFGAKSLHLLDADQIGRFDVLLPISLIAAASAQGLPLHRSRHILHRVRFGDFHRHYEAYREAAAKGFWAQHYELVTNYNHELNALYDVHHESPVAREIIDQVSGHALPPMPPVDPAIHAVNGFIGRLRPVYRYYKKIRNMAGWGGRK